MTVDRVTGYCLSGWLHYGEMGIAHHQESFLYRHFEDMCEILKAYDISSFRRWYAA